MTRTKAILVACFLLLFMLIASPFLLLTARRWRGRLEGLFGLDVAAFLIFSLVCIGSTLLEVERPAYAEGIAIAAVFLFPLLCLLANFLSAPRAPDPGPVGSHFWQSSVLDKVMRWSDIEDDYLGLIIQIITRVDLRMPRREARETRARVAELLDAVALLPEYCGLPRVSPAQSRLLLQGSLDPCHCYSYRPEPREPGERFGLLVFLHGHGEGYLFIVHALRPICDALRLCLVAPSFGYGNWEASGGVEAIDRATRFGLAAFDADPARVILAGYSQGGAGVSRGGAANPARYTGLVFISPTMELDVIGSDAFATGWKGRPVLVIQGERDPNVRPASVTAAVQQMQADGVNVTEHRDPDSGHFLFFAKHDEVLAVIVAWARMAL